MSIPQETIKLLVSIVDHGCGKHIKKFCEENNIYFSIRLYGVGTASSDLLALLGLDGADKDIILSLVPSSRTPAIIKSISKLMNMGSPGKGIAFSIPLGALNSLAAKEINDFLVDAKNLPPANGPRKEETMVEFSLIIAVYNAGYTDDVVAVARDAGATGGTVIHARGIAKEAGEKHFGLTIQDDKEVMIVLSPADLSRPILDALNTKCGPNTESHALVMSVPVHEVVGLG